MHVLLTSAHGWLGSHITPLLLGAGHKVTGLARTSSSADKILSLAAVPIPNPLERPEDIASFVQTSHVDAIIHTACDHQWTPGGDNIAMDLAFIKTMGAVLKGTNKPFIVTFTVSTLTEDEAPRLDHPSRRTANEAAVMQLASQASQGVRAMIIRLPPTVHGRGDTKFVAALVEAAKDKGVSVYPEGDKGTWSAVHVKDAARLYVLAMERGEAGKRYHAVAEKGIKVKDIAETIADRLGVEARAVIEAELEGYVGFLAPFLKTDYTAEAEITERELGWEPEESGLLDNIRDGGYFSNERVREQSH